MECGEDKLSDDYQCPKCHGRVKVELTCPTYLVDGTLNL